MQVGVRRDAPSENLQSAWLTSASHKERELRSPLPPLFLALFLSASASDAQDEVCSQTARAAWVACRSEASDDFWNTAGRCLNTAELADRQECLEEAGVARHEAQQECDEQLEARLQLCQALGEAPYDPEFEPADFVDPLEIGGSVAPNPLFPLVPGSRWVYQGGGETVTVEVVGEVKEILGVPCTVVRDVVVAGGEVIEFTEDWFAQDVDGTVWYCGELSRELEDGELVSLEGSWQAGRDLARPGVIMPGDPAVGGLYRQEFALGDAEDAIAILSLVGSVSTPAAICGNDCAVTLDLSPLEPGAFELKFYKPGVGRVLELSLVTFGRTELVDFEIPTP